MVGGLLPGLGAGRGTPMVVPFRRVTLCEDSTMATAAIIISLLVSLLALAISAYQASVARSERFAGMQGRPSVGDSYVWIIDDAHYEIDMRVTNIGKAIISYLRVELVTPDGQAVLPERHRERKGLPGQGERRIRLQVKRSSIPENTQMLHAHFGWNDASARGYEYTSRHKIKLNEARERPADQ